MTAVIAGRPNADKFSLPNALADRKAVIVTDITGTTCDVPREHIHIDGTPLRVVDTAGLRDTEDHAEGIGAERALRAIGEADRVLPVADTTAPEVADPFSLWSEFLDQRPEPGKVTLIRNKADLSTEPIGLEEGVGGHVIITLSTRTGVGLELLREHLKACTGFEQVMESGFSARRRHLGVLRLVGQVLEHGHSQLIHNGAGELLVEDLYQAQQHLSEITSTFTPDDLLGRIFSSLCIGE